MSEIDRAADEPVPPSDPVLAPEPTEPPAITTPDPPPSPKAAAAREPRLLRWHAIVALVFGGIAAQVMGIIAMTVTAGAMVAFRASSLHPDEIGRVAAEAASSFAALAAAGLGVGGMLFTVAVGTGWAVGQPARETLGLKRAPWVVAVLAVLGTVGLGPLADLVMTWFASLFPDLTLSTIPQLNALARETPIWMLWPVLALTPGFCEEVFFRGMVQRAFGRGLVAIVVSATSFALIHLDPHHVVGVLPLGFWLAWVAARADSTWPTIVAHVANNTLAVIATQVPELDRGYGGTTGAMPWHWVPVGLAVTAVCAVLVVVATRRYSPAR